LPCFNDLHHVVTHENKDYIVNTGLDSVVEVVDKVDTKQFSTLQFSQTSKYQPNIDYRQIATTKPHLTHPNFGFVLNNKLWATRCDTMDAICLEDDSLRIDIGHNLVHDGVLYKGSIYFTNVDGQVQVFDADTRKLKLTSNLNHFIPNINGWCRGVLPISTNLVVVGFSKNRSSKKLKVANGSYGKIILIDILKHRKIWEVNTSEMGLDAIFSILPGDQQ
jgi:outer membrane protein assembly factor BamB